MTNFLLGWNSWGYDPITSDQFKQNQKNKIPNNKDIATSRIYDCRDEIIYYTRRNYMSESLNFNKAYRYDFK